MEPIDQVEVYYEQFVLGWISVYENGALSFSYDQRWLDTNGSFPLSVTLPLSSERYEDEVIVPWLANLLPEEQQLATLSRALGLSASDSLAILKEIGGDTAGAISIEQPSIRSDWSYTTLREHYGRPDEQ